MGRVSDPERKWAIEVGRFVLAFGEVEHLTIALMGCLPGCTVPKTAPELQLSTRFKMLEEVLKRCPDPAAPATLASMRKVSSLNGDRNVVAHNSVWFTLYRSKSGVGIEEHIVSARDQRKRLNYSEMVKLADRAEAHAEEFGRNALELLRNYRVPEEGTF